MCVKQRRTPSADEDGDNDAWRSSAEGELIVDVSGYVAPTQNISLTRQKHIFLKNWTPLEQFMTVRKTLIHKASRFLSPLSSAS